MNIYSNIHILYVLLHLAIQLAIYDVMTYKLTQLGHDVQNWSVTVVHAVNVSTTRCRVELSCVGVAIDTSTMQLNSTRRRVELSCVVINGALDSKGNACSVTSNNTKLVHWPLMGRLWAAICCGSTQFPPRCTKYNSPPINGQCTNHCIAVSIKSINIAHRRD